MAGVAILAKEAGFEVSGCDLSPDSYYLEALKKVGIKVSLGHDLDHLQNVDLLAVSPAVFDKSRDHPELLEAKRKGILMTWQEFLGRILQKNKFVICVSGTHGKSTTTALLGRVLEDAGFDPSVALGAIVGKWGKTVRSGRSKWFVCEGDEFGGNFLHYSPSLLLINNLEMDHPEYFTDFNEIILSFEKLIERMSSPKILVVNEDAPGIKILLERMKDFLQKEEYQVVGFRLGGGFSFPFENRYLAKITDLGQEATHFKVIFSQDSSQKAIIEENFQMRLAGVHNVYNALGVIACAYLLEVDLDAIKKTIFSFEGVARRLEKIGEGRGVLIFDDYGHHPTAIKATIRALRQKHPGKRIWAIFEPHQISRLRLFKKEFAKVLAEADKVIVTQVFEGREKLTKGESGQMLVDEINLPKARYIGDFDKVVELVDKEVRKGDCLLVFGAGKSYQLSQKILERLKDGE